MEWRRRFEFNLDLICQRWGPISLLANFPNFPILEFIRCIRRKIPARSIDLFRSNLHRQFFDHGEFKDSYLFCWILHVKADSNRFNITFIIILSFVTCWSFPTVFAVYNNNKVSTHTISCTCYVDTGVLSELSRGITMRIIPHFSNGTRDLAEGSTIFLILSTRARYKKNTLICESRAEKQTIFDSAIFFFWREKISKNSRNE